MKGIGSLLAALLSLSAANAASAENWPGWRGPRDDGTSQEQNVPLTWSAGENVKWKVPLPESGNSTPIVWENKVFLSQSLDKGGRRALMCFDRAQGELLWSREIDGPREEPTHKTNPYCSSSPVTDGQAVYVWQGSAGVVACDLDGKQLWHTDLGTFTHIWGFGSSPVLYKDLVILNCGPGERAFVVALNKKTGEKVWEVAGVTGKADQFLGSWASPKLISHDGQDQLLIAHPHALVACNPADGKELWRCRGLTDLVYATPLVADGVAVAMSGYHGRALAVKLGGAGDITDSNRLWITPEGEKEHQRIGSGIILGGHIYSVNEPTFECIELTTGKSLWRERAGGTKWSSLVLAENRFYVVDQGGNTIVLAAKPELEILAENKLGETTNGSLAVSQGNIFIRTHRHLWCIGK